MTLNERERALLERYRPFLLYDPQEDLRALSVESVTIRRNLLRGDDGEVLADHDDPDLPDLSLDLLTRERDAAHIVLAPDVARTAHRLQRDPAYANRLYGRCKVHDGRRYLQYWLWMYDNPKNVLGLGSHQGDWEMVQIALRDDDVPDAVTLSQHQVGERRSWAKVERRGERPVVYVAMLSHALYFEPWTHPYPGGIDHPYPGGPAPDTIIEEFGAWAEWGGRWGDRVRVMRGRFGNPPQSPGRQTVRWETPGDFKDGSWRWLSRLLGKAARWAGHVTYPRDPQIAARLEDGGVAVTYTLPRGRRGGRHVYITVHTADGEHVLATRRIENAPRAGADRFRIPGAEPGLIVRASSFNRVRQRSNVVSATV